MFFYMKPLLSTGSMNFLISVRTKKVLHGKSSQYRKNPKKRVLKELRQIYIATPWIHFLEE